jgi:hypothetical protein
MSTRNKIERDRRDAGRPQPLNLSTPPRNIERIFHTGAAGEASVSRFEAAADREKTKQYTDTLRTRNSIPLRKPALSGAFAVNTR